MSTKTGARRGERVPADTLPVARIVVDVPLAHLDRPSTATCWSGSPPPSTRRS
ncbi:hypothetical protein [Lentzea guizhouensis]|uniref:hypothetical protein n=1 Tax=Lentzea guizhouensis TaxID=1586287 RepID=UPI0015D3A136